MTFALAFVACVPAPVTGVLTPSAGRITDEAIAADRALFASWGQRLDQLPSAARATPAGAYQAALSRAWLRFATDEYQDNDRGGIIEHAFDAASRGITRLEAGSVAVDGEIALPPGVRRVRPELWQEVRRFKDHARFDLVATEVGALEIELLRAGHQGAPGAACSSAPHETKADSLAKQIDRVLRAAPPLPPPVPVVVPVPPIIPPTPLVPPPDSDRDGVPDRFDCCPNSPAGAIVDANGCERLPAMDVPLILDGVTFETDKSVLRPESRTILARIAEVLAARPDIEIEISGHTDSISSADYNQRLSAARAASVRAYLIARGVDATRITSIGAGEARPIDDNGTVAGRSRNRRVELVWRRPERTAEREPSCRVLTDSAAPNLLPTQDATPVVLEDVRFAFESSQLTSDASTILERVASGLRARADVSLVVVGHADSVGPESFNRSLSFDRAASVSAFLSSRGVLADRLESRGEGEMHPIATNATSAGRSLNRRVELWLAGTVPGVSRPNQAALAAASRAFGSVLRCEPARFAGAPCELIVPASSMIAIDGPALRAGDLVLSPRTQALLDGVAIGMARSWSEDLEIRSPNDAWNDAVRRYLISRGVESPRLIVTNGNASGVRVVELRRTPSRR